MIYRKTVNVSYTGGMWSMVNGLCATAKNLVYCKKKCQVKLLAFIQGNITYIKKMLYQRLFLHKASFIR